MQEQIAATLKAATQQSEAVIKASGQQAEAALEVANKQAEAALKKEAVLFRLQVYLAATVELENLLSFSENGNDFEKSKNKIFTKIFPKVKLINDNNVVAIFNEIVKQLVIYQRLLEVTKLNEEIKVLIDRSVLYNLKSRSVDHNRIELPQTRYSVFEPPRFSFTFLVEKKKIIASNFDTLILARASKQLKIIPDRLEQLLFSLSSLTQNRKYSDTARYLGLNEVYNFEPAKSKKIGMANNLDSYLHFLMFIYVDLAEKIESFRKSSRKFLGIFSGSPFLKLMYLGLKELRISKQLIIY